ncbi:integrase [Escherichia coli]
MTDINHDNAVCPSSSFSGSPYLYQQVCTSSPDTRLTQIKDLAVPQLVRRANGRYTIRFRLKGQTIPFLSVSTRSTDRRVATMRQRELAATAKSFMLDRPDVSLQELTDHLRSMAEQFLTDASDDYWNGLEVATLVDEKSNLKELAATQALSLDQQKGIRLALEVLTAAQQRVDTGDASGLIKLIDDNNHTDYSTIGDSTSILRNEQGVSPQVFTRERQPSVVFSSLVSSLLAEKVQTLKSSSYKDLSSSLNTVSRFLPEDMDLMSRSEWLAVRDSMLAAEVRPSTINKLLTKAKMCLDYGLMNGHLEGRNPIERMKLVKDIDSKRRAFTDEELERLLGRVESEYQFTRHTAHTTSEARRWASLVSVVTGARSAEVCHLTKRDIVTLDNGLVCIDINEDGEGNLVDAQGILGHSSQSITYDLYGKGHAVGRLADVLKTALL